MPDLLDRILGYLAAAESDLAISYEAILAAMDDVDRDNLSQAQDSSALNLSAGDETSFLVVYNQMFPIGTATLSTAEYRTVMVLGSTRNRANGVAGGAYYPKALVMSRLGL